MKKTQMKFTALAAAFVCSGLGTQLQAGDTFVGVALTSDYVVGGRSFSDDSPAISGYVEHGFDSGLYLGAWASTMDFYGDKIELDLYGGYRGMVGQLSYDVGYFRYYYDESGDGGGEVIASVDYQLSDAFSMGLTYKNDFGSAYDFNVVKGGPHATYNFGEGFSLSADYELNNFDPSEWDFGKKSDVVSVKLEKQFNNGVALALNYQDRTIDEIDPEIALTVSFNTILSAMGG